MNPPKLIYVGPNDYTVQFKKHLDLLGETKNNESVILLKSTQSASNMRGTLMHELVHVILFQSGLSPSMSLSYEDEERIVVTIAPWILALLRDNPVLVAYLMENREREF